MKKLLIYLAVVAFLISCGGSDDTDNKGKNPSMKNDPIKEKEPSSNSNSNSNEEEKLTGGPCNKPVSDNGSSPTPLSNC